MSSVGSDCEREGGRIRLHFYPKGRNRGVAAIKLAASNSPPGYAGLVQDGFAFLRKNHGRANSPPDCLLGPAFRIRPPNIQTQKKTNPKGLVFFWQY